ncbi:unnamed protein product [Caenorhabditis brenneri]
MCGRPMKKGKRVHSSAVQRDGPGTSQQEHQVEQASSNGERHQSPQPVLRMGGTSRHEEEAAQTGRSQKRPASSPHDDAPSPKKNRGEDQFEEEDGRRSTERGEEKSGEEDGNGATERDQSGGDAESEANERRGKLEGSSRTVICCSISKKHAPRNLQCASSNKCFITPEKKYFDVFVDGKESGLVVCKRHKQMYEKKNNNSSFSEIKTNPKTQQEKRLTCEKCGSQHHPTCSMYHPAIEGETFVCRNCVPRTRSNAADLEEDDLSKFLQEKLKETGALCRTLSVSQKEGKLNEDEFPFLSKLLQPVPYIQKIIGIFSKIGDSYVLTLIMFVHEYKNVQSRKNNTVHLHLLDSVNFFEFNRNESSPNPVNKIAFQAFCSYAQSSGFETIHFHAEPPVAEQDYVFNGHPITQVYPLPPKLINWYTARLTKFNPVERIDKGLRIEESDALEDILDRHCYEHGFFPSEMEKQLKELKKKGVLDETRMLEVFKEHFEEFRESLFFVKLKKPAKVQQAEEVIFSSCFVTEDFLEHQRLNSLEFHTLDAAKLATQTIVELLLMERKGFPLRVVLPKEKEEIEISQNSPSQDAQGSSSAKNEDEPQASHPELRVEGTSSNEEHGDDVMEIDVEEEQTGEEAEEPIVTSSPAKEAQASATSSATALTPNVAVNEALEIPNAAPVDVSADGLSHVDEQAPVIELEGVARDVPAGEHAPAPVERQEDKQEILHKNDQKEIVHGEMKNQRIDPFNMAALLAALPDVGDPEGDDMPDPNVPAVLAQNAAGVPAQNVPPVPAQNVLPALHRYELRPRATASTPQMAIRHLVRRVAPNQLMAQARRVRRPRKTQNEILAELQLERMEAQLKRERQNAERLRRFNVRNNIKN